MGISITFWSCQSDNNPIGVENHSDDIRLNKSILSSAKLFLYVKTGGTHKVNIHLLKENWDLNEVSWYERTVDSQWKKPGGTFNKNQLISFIPNGNFEWIEIDFFDFLRKWQTGKPNYGIILEQDLDKPLVNFASANHPNLIGYGPKLVLTYSDGTEKTIMAKVDCAIWNTEEDTRADAGWLNVGVGTTVPFEHRVLIKFDLPEDIVSGDENCTHTKAYWKTHAKGKKKDPTWDLLPEGTKTKFFNSKKTYYNVISRKNKRDLYYMLASEYIATELNLLSGTDPTDIQNSFDKATEIFNTYTPKDLKKWWRNKEKQKQIFSLVLELKAYNFGEIGPGHCDDYKWDDDKEWDKHWKKKWGKWWGKP